MKKSKLSINDIADKLKISKTTVSFILNGKAKEKRISDKLAEKVLKTVEKLGYKPNQFAQSLRTGKTKIIGLMVEDIADPFFASLAKHIEDAAYKWGYKIIFCSTENEKTRAREFLKMFRHLGVDGFIITPPPGIDDDIKDLVDNDEQVILFDRFLKKVPTNYVIINNEQSMYDGAQHLISQGYKKIALVTLQSNQPQMAGRLKGYERAMKKNGLKSLVHKLKFSSDYSKSADKIVTFIQENRSIDAILFGTGYIGVSGIEALARLNIKIPTEIAVASFDDTDLFRINRPAITAISQPMERLSETLVNTLLRNIENQGTATASKKPDIFELPTTLIIRDSSVRKK